MPTRSIHGVDIYYEDSGGSAVPIVFSHGFLWSGRMFAPQVAELRGRYRCVSYDHRGQGRSGSSPRRYDMEQVYEDAVTLIEELKVGPCHFVGLSMGGFVGLRLAIRRPELLRSLTLIESAADAEPRWNIPKYKAMSLVARLFGYRPLLPSVMKIMFARTFLRDGARAVERRAQEAEILSLQQPRVEAALYSVTSRLPVFAQLGGIKTPTQVVHGTEDAAIIPARARRTCDAIPGARWVEIPRAGHTSTIEEPAAVTAAIESFIAGVPG